MLLTHMAYFVLHKSIRVQFPATAALSRMFLLNYFWRRYLVTTTVAHHVCVSLSLSHAVSSSLRRLHPVCMCLWVSVSTYVINCRDTTNLRGAEIAPHVLPVCCIEETTVLLKPHTHVFTSHMVGIVCRFAF
jgi:hypothetical protein